MVFIYSIQYAEICDSEILGYIHSKSWQMAYKGIIPDEILENFTPEKRYEYFKKALSEKRGEYALVFEGDKAVGLVCFGKCRDKDLDCTYGEVSGIYLLPDYWHKGIGSYLLKWSLTELRNRNYKAVTLWVLEKNLSARKFYETLGFEFDGTIKEMKLGNILKEYRYRKDIGECI